MNVGWPRSRNASGRSGWPGPNARVAPFRWTAIDGLTIDEVRHHGRKNKGRLADVTAVVAELLKDGPRESTDLEAAVEGQGLPCSLVLKARHALGAKAIQIGRSWWAYLPEHADQIETKRAEYAAQKAGKS